MWRPLVEKLGLLLSSLTNGTRCCLLKQRLILVKMLQRLTANNAKFHCPENYTTALNVCWLPDWPLKKSVIFVTGMQAAWAGTHVKRRFRLELPGLRPKSGFESGKPFALAFCIHAREPKTNRYNSVIHWQREPFFTKSRFVGKVYMCLLPKLNHHLEILCQGWGLDSKKVSFL